MFTILGNVRWFIQCSHIWKKNTNLEILLFSFLWKLKIVRDFKKIHEFKILHDLKKDQFS